MSTMVVASGAGRSSLNPNAPLFIPAAFQQVEDFSPEWWELVKTTSWFRDHWFHQHQDQETFDGDDEEEEDIANLLPDSFDLGITDDFSNFESDFEEAAFIESAKIDNVLAHSALKQERDKFGGWCRSIDQELKLEISKEWCGEAIGGFKQV